MARHPGKENRKKPSTTGGAIVKGVEGLMKKKTPWVGYTSGENVPKQNAQNVGVQGNGISVRRMKREIGVLRSKNDMIWLTLTQGLFILSRFRRVLLEHFYLSFLYVSYAKIYHDFPKSSYQTASDST